jgi:hypothetical protein
MGAPVFLTIVLSFLSIIILGIVAIVKGKTVRMRDFVLGESSPLGKIDEQRHDGSNESVVATAYKRYSSFVNEHTSIFLNRIYGKCIGYYIAFLRDNGFQEIDRSRKLELFKKSLSIAIHTKLMPDTLEAVYDNNIPDVSRDELVAVVGGSDSIEHISKALLWYQKQFEHLSEALHNGVEENWLDHTFEPREVFTHWAKWYERDYSALIIELFEGVKRKRDNIFEAIGSEEKDFKPNRVSQRFNEYFVQSGITRLMRG